MIRALSLFLCLTLSMPVYAHGPVDHPDGSLVATFELYQKLVNLAPDELDRHSAATPFVIISGQKVWLNGPFWELTRGWIRVYYRAMQEQCDGCIDWSEADFVQAAEDEIAKSFFAAKIKKPIMNGIEHVVVGAADVGARLGKFALLAKISAEVAETILSKMAFLGGMHFFCHMIDAFIIFGTRHLQTFARAIGWAGKFDASIVANIVKFGFVSRVAKEAQERVRFTINPVELNEDQLKEVDLSGPNRWWGWVSGGKRAAWVKKVFAGAKEGSDVTALARKEFLGKRMKRFLLLKGRKRGNASFMHGKGPMEKVLNRDLLWVFEVQESILERSFIADREELEVERESVAVASAPSSDEIRQGLAEEFAGGDEERADVVANLLKEVEVVFNPDVSRKVRYFQASALENLTSGFMYAMFSQVLDEKGDLYGNSFGGIWNQARLRWKTARFARYMYEWADFLKVAALQDDPGALMRSRYEAMESFLKILDYYKATEPLLAVKAVPDLRGIEDLLSGKFSEIMTFRPWREKRASMTWLPMRAKCAELDKAAGQ